MLMAIQFGKGRIFHTTLGHVGPKDTELADSVNCFGFITTFLRGTEWAATGKVTQAVPRDFPLADKTSVRKPKRRSRNQQSLERRLKPSSR